MRHLIVDVFGWRACGRSGTLLCEGGENFWRGGEEGGGVFGMWTVICRENRDKMGEKEAPSSTDASYWEEKNKREENVKEGKLRNCEWPAKELEAYNFSLSSTFATLFSLNFEPRVLVRTAEQVFLPDSSVLFVFYHCLLGERKGGKREGCGRLAKELEAKVGFYSHLLTALFLIKLWTESSRKNCGSSYFPNISMLFK